MPKIVYGRTAYEGFAKALGAKMGLNVKIEDGASPCIDANGVVRLPGMNTYQTEKEFEITCAAIVHELSHQFYESHGQIDPNRSRLEHDCLNAVLDVADESGIAHWFAEAGNKRPGDLLDFANTHTLNTNNALFNWNNPGAEAWKILCTGILDARLPRCRRLSQIKRCNAHHAQQSGVDAKKCYAAIRRAKRLKTDNGAPNPKRFTRLIKLAQELAKLLAPFANSASSASAPSPLEIAACQGAGQVPQGAVEATESNGADRADERTTQGASASGNTSSAYRACEGSCQMLYPAVERIGQRIATDGDGASLLDGLANGPSLGQAYRLATDGACLARWQMNDNADGVAVAVVLDCSGSMSHQLSQCAGIARAFALGMRQCGEVVSIAFGSYVRECDDFARVDEMGGTNTHEALEHARKWLNARHGAKWIVLVTDGQPNDQYAAEIECQRARQTGIKTLAVGLNCNIKLPEATIVTAADPAHLAIELQNAASMIESN